MLSAAVYGQYPHNFKETTNCFSLVLSDVDNATITSQFSVNSR